MTTVTQQSLTGNYQNGLNVEQSSQEPGFIRLMRGVLEKANAEAKEYELTGYLSWSKKVVQVDDRNPFTYFEVQYVEEADCEDDTYRSSTFKVVCVNNYSALHLDDPRRHRMLQLTNVETGDSYIIQPQPLMLLAFLSF